jgi:hypothetical protein
MMGDFQNVSLQARASIHQGSFAARADITREQYPITGHLGSQNQRIFIRGVFCRAGQRPDRLKNKIPHLSDRIACIQFQDRHAPSLSQDTQSRKPVSSSRGGRQPDFSNFKLSQDMQQTSAMIQIRVTGHECIQAYNAQSPEPRFDHASSHIPSPNE